MTTSMVDRFRGYLPVVIDVETGGFNAQTDALLELAAVTLRMNEAGKIEIADMYHYHIVPFKNANLDPSALAFTGIDPYHPFRQAIEETQALNDLFSHIRNELKKTACKRAVLVGHNPWFDLSFIRAAIARNHIKKDPFHQFTTFDTAALSALIYGETVLAKAAEAAQLPFDKHQAHSALYDAKVTAELFCRIVNSVEFKGNE
jgi:ribonuclease T